MTVRALVLDSPRELALRELPEPSLGPADGLLRVEACGLCGTDHEQYTGALPGARPFVPGHETVGVIEAIGDDAARRWGVSEGDRVAVEVFQSCRSCESCRAGVYRRCERHGMRDMYGFVPVDHAPGLWGGYAERQYLAPDSMLLPVPEAGDPKPQTAADVALALREVKTTGGYWAARNGENMAMVRLTSRIINRLPHKELISAAESEALWQQALAPEKELTGEPLAWNRRYVDYCRENALLPGSFPMRHCLGNAHDWFLKDLNTDYWKSLKPTS